MFIDHVHIYTNHLNDTVEFYKNVFGATELRRISRENDTLVHLQINNTRIVVSNASEKNPVGLGHFAFGATNLDETIEMLISKGIETTPRVNVGKIANTFIQDPNGVSIEILSPGTN